MRRAQREERYEVAWNVGGEPVSFEIGGTPIEPTDITRVYDEWMEHHRVEAERNHNLVEEMLAREEHLAEVRDEYTNYLAGRTSAEIPTPNHHGRIETTRLDYDPTYITDPIGGQDIMLISRSTYERYMEEGLLQEDMIYYVYKDDDFMGKREMIDHPKNEKKVVYFID